MKYLTYVLVSLVSLAVIHPATAQVCTGDVILNTQTQVNAFACSEVTGNLVIETTGQPAIVDLNALTELRIVGGFLMLQENMALLSLAGLNNLVSAGSISILDNDVLLSLEGLERLTTVGEGFYVQDNAALASLEGLEAIRSIGGDLRVERNPALTSMAGIGTGLTLGGLVVMGNESLESFMHPGTLAAFSGTLTVMDNPNLTALTGLEPVTELGEVIIRVNRKLRSLTALRNLTRVTSLLITDSPTLTTVEGLENLVTVEGNLDFTADSALTNLDGLRSLTSIGGSLYLVHNTSLVSIEGLSHLETIGEALYLIGNSALVDLSGLEGLTVVPNDFWIDGHTSLQSIEALKNLTSVGRWFWIIGNPALKSLHGLEKLTHVGLRLYVEENAALEECVCALVGLMSGGLFTTDVYINNNNEEGPCTTTEEVLAIPCNPTPGVDATAPVCGPITVVREGGKAVAVETTARDPESGIARIHFTALNNALGTVDGTSGPYTTGSTHTSPEPYPQTVQVRADKVDLKRGATLLVEITNGGGLKRTCDPVVQTVEAELPETYALKQNVPNPFNPATTIRFELPERAPVRLVVYDALGREVALLVDETLEAGAYTITWNASHVPSGTYLVRWTAGGYVESRLMTLVK